MERETGSTAKNPNCLSAVMVGDEPTPNNILSPLIFAAHGAVVMHSFVFQGSGATHIAPVIDL
jgi:hypothetical protein